MDVDNFYDEIASYMPTPGEYDLDDLEEILRSTDSHLDSSIDFNNFDFKAPPQDTEMQKAAWKEFSFDFSEFSPATTNVSTPPHDASQRTLSTSSLEGDSYNTNDIYNLFDEKNFKNENFTPMRSTPSPTGSCTSSSGSSTSGVQSDASSEVKYDLTNMDFIKTENSSDEVPNKLFVPSTVLHANYTLDSNYDCVTKTEEADYDEEMYDVGTAMREVPKILVDNKFPIQNIESITTGANILPMSMPILPMHNSTPTIQLQPLQQVQPVIIPVKTVQIAAGIPVTNIKAPTSVKSVAQATVKNEAKIAPKTAAQPIKIVAGNATKGKVFKDTPPQTTTTAAAAGNTNSSTNTNFKPKTVFLSSNDFKALMQKMNSNGKGAKISGGITGQMPKIIMKTANGKVITANKIVQPASISNTQNSKPIFMPKIVKANGPMVIKQPNHKTNNPPISTTSAVAKVPVTASTAPDLSVYKGIMDEKMLKKQQRMIKNRESASLSRKKKKEYVTSLETRINNLEKENYSLKGENSSLRSQLVAFAQTCQCKNSNISEFILHSLNINNCTGADQQNVKIASKPSLKGIKQRMSAANIKKNVAVLFAMAFMVTMNVGNFQNYLNKHGIENSVEAEEPVAIGRRLLWVEPEKELNETAVHRVKRDAELDMPPPPLHFIRPVNRTRAGITFNSTAHEPPLGSRSDGMGDSFNHTENLRLASNLHKWIDGNDFLNLSLHKSIDNDLDNHIGFKLTPDYFETIDLPLQKTLLNGKQKRKYIVEDSEYNNKQSKLNMEIANKNGNRFDDNIYEKGKRNDYDDDNGNVNGNGNRNNKNSLDLYKHKISEEYLRLFKGINRKDDTFYVLSFNMDHILLPASAYNKSARPKMSLMLPAGDPSLNGDVVLMQIDCEVVNTTEFELKSQMIPEKLRPSKYAGPNFHPTPNANDVVKNETGGQAKSNEKLSVRPDEPRVKPPIRTYFMSGAKSQAPSLRKKVTIVKLDGSEAVDTSNVKNSTLFAKMRETVKQDYFTP
ncbi:uncharacterized protein LOC119678063 [Teleopsis dalmanni]|uniref:uncharacterized protein LOC119678063 n=1 Tax=Teleopsis dalmanni TaxID=139649 RepID=UPI0018CF3E72|nr:uncharacterized protein LOC119678063 [Teleopsis dalmanni]